MPTILISGAANGLGAAFVEAYHSKPNVRILAVDRAQMHTKHSSVDYFNVDLTDEDSVSNLMIDVKDLTIDRIIHSAGVRGLVPQMEDKKPDDVAACETMDVMDTATLRRAFDINAIGTFNLLRAILPNLQQAVHPKVITMSSRMGSIGNNQRPNNASGSAYAYRASKAAQNAIVRSFAVDFPNVTFVMCHPGRVETQLVRCKEDGAITAEESVTAIMPLIEQWTMKDSGKFYDRFGQTIEW